MLDGLWLWFHSVFYENILDCPVDFFLSSTCLITRSFFLSFFLFLSFGAFFLYFVIFVIALSICYTHKLELREQEKLLGEDGEAYDQHFDGYNRPEDTVAFSTFSTRFLVQPACFLLFLCTWLFFMLLVVVVVLSLVALCPLHCRWNGVCMVMVFALVLVSGS